MTSETKDLLRMFFFFSFFAMTSIAVFLLIVKAEDMSSTEKAQLEWIKKNKAFFCKERE